MDLKSKRFDSLRFKLHQLQALILTSTCGLADIISTVEFDQTGNYLATGDKGGRVVLFERNDTVNSARQKQMSKRSKKRYWLRVPFIEEEDLWVQVPHWVSVPWAGVRLPQISGDWGEDQQNQMVPTTKCLSLPLVYQWQDYQTMESVWKITQSGRGK